MVKDADRAFKREFGRSDDIAGDPYSRLKARLVEDLFDAADSQEQVNVARKATLRATVREEVEADLQAQADALRTVAEELGTRETELAAKEKKASPSYRAQFAAAGAGAVLS